MKKLIALILVLCSLLVFTSCSTLSGILDSLDIPGFSTNGDNVIGDYLGGNGDVTDDNSGNGSNDVTDDNSGDNVGDNTGDNTDNTWLSPVL